jgi:hypothetical protein
MEMYDAEKFEIATRTRSCAWLDSKAARKAANATKQAAAFVFIMTFLITIAADKAKDFSTHARRREVFRDSGEVSQNLEGNSLWFVIREGRHGVCIYQDRAPRKRNQKEFNRKERKGRKGRKGKPIVISTEGRNRS